MNHFTPFLPLNDIAIHTFQERGSKADLETRLLEGLSMRRQTQLALEALLLVTIPFALIIAAAAQVAP